MRHTQCAAAVLLALGLASPAARAIELTNYTDPDTSFDEAYVDFNASARDGNQEQMSYDALLSAFYESQTSTRERVLTYRFDADYDASRGSNDNDDTLDDYGASFGVKADTYFSEANENLLWFGSGSGLVRVWFGSANYAVQDSAEDDNAGFTVGVGYGRVWNATPLAKALRVQASLLDNGQITSGLSDAAASNLADIIAREDEFRASVGEDTYRGTWYSEMEALLAEEGLLAERFLERTGSGQAG